MPVEQSFSLVPASDVRRLEVGDAWLAAGAPIRFELDPGAHRFPEGWVLITGKLSRTILDGSARLLIERDGDSQPLEVRVPVSVTGTVFELLRLPPRIRRLVWEPSSLAGTFQHTPLTIRKVGLPERRWLMTQRVAAMLWLQPGEKKKQAGLNWLRPWYDLPGAYQASGRLRSYAPPLPYVAWNERFGRLAEKDRALIHRRIAALRNPPHFVIIVQADAQNAENTVRVAQTLRSVEKQLYRNYSIVMAGQGRTPEYPLAPEASRYVSVLHAGDRLAEHALYWVAEAICAGSDVAMAYADEDALDPQGRRTDPRFKPDWSPAHLRSINYVGRWAVFRGKDLEAAGGLQPHDLAGDGHELNVRVAQSLAPAQIVHVPAVLYHRGAANPASLPRPRARHRLPENTPLVSIVIPTRDRAVLLRRCIESIARKTTYPKYEILVVDNQSRDERAVAYLRELDARPGVRVLRYDHPFNYAAINNIAAREARGEVLLLLNNDTKVISRDWLEEMLGHLVQERVAVVGAKLYFPDGRVQHAGDAVGPGGCADHLHAGIARDSPGYCHRAIVAQEVSAVTGACLMTWKRVYDALDGLDAENLPVAFNDVDYCLRAQEAGWRVVFTPYAELHHRESASRGTDMSPKQRARARREVRYMRQRWGKRMRHDPYYNPNLSYDRPDFSLGNAPRAIKPWLR